VNPAQEPGGDNIALFPSDPNKGLVLLSVNGGPAASATGNTAAASGPAAYAAAAPVLSVLPTVPEETTYSYRYTASTDDDVKDKLVEGEILPGDSPLPVELAGGLWTITVKAWEGTAPAEDEEDPPAPAFVGTAELDVGAGAAQPLVVSLLPNGEGTGTFSYSVTFTNGTNFPGGLGYALISVFPLDGGAAVDVIDLLTGQGTYGGITTINGQRKLPGGYYNITTAVNYKDGTNQKFATKREVLYIYDGLTSSYPVTFETGDFTALLPALSGPTDTEQEAPIRTFTTKTIDIWGGIFEDYAIYNQGIFPSTFATNSLMRFLERCPQNTPDTPYLIALTGFKLDGSDAAKGGGSLGTSEDPIANILAATQGRYVIYDLSACTGELGDVSRVVDDVPGYELLRTYPDRVVGVIMPATGVTKFGNAFMGLTSLRFIKLPGSITSFSKAAFYGCSSLVSIDIPAGISTLCANATQNDYDYALFDYFLGGASSLKYVTLRNKSAMVAIKEETFSMAPLEAVYVDGAMIENYREAAGSDAWYVLFNKIKEKNPVLTTENFFRVIPGTEKGG
jgi:hypothetical protein